MVNVDQIKAFPFVHNNLKHIKQLKTLAFENQRICKSVISKSFDPTSD